MPLSPYTRLVIGCDTLQELQGNQNDKKRLRTRPYIKT